jgi:hypothetical protein
MSLSPTTGQYNERFQFSISIHSRRVQHTTNICTPITRSLLYNSMHMFTQYATNGRPPDWKEKRYDVL